MRPISFSAIVCYSGLYIQCRPSSVNVLLVTQEATNIISVTRKLTYVIQIPVNVMERVNEKKADIRVCVLTNIPVKYFDLCIIVRRTE